MSNGSVITDQYTYNSVTALQLPDLTSFLTNHRVSASTLCITLTVIVLYVKQTAQDLHILEIFQRSQYD